ncbi:MAG: hypothetical protein IAE82_15705 [Opitutaceae bacterium]|nr:hypothetical protein [Opitutaceae bacterium]
MNTPEDSLEGELRALRPAAPSLRLAGRIGADLARETSAAPTSDPARRRARPRDASLWLAWGVAAAMTVAFFVRTPPSSPRPGGPATAPPPTVATGPVDQVAGTPRFLPVSTTKTLIGALDEGVVFLEDGQPARKVRYEFLDTVDLRSADAPGARVNVTYPREEIRLVPVQTY